MRFVVDIFRVLVLAVLALLLVGAAFVGFTLAFGGHLVDIGVPWAVAIVSVAAIVVVTGLLAILIAIHDRLAELAAVSARADTLDLSSAQRLDGDT